eukprot:jgi/Picre1/33003/NNA_008330.t1
MLLPFAAAHLVHGLHVLSLCSPKATWLGEYGCKHYRRRVKFVAPCCGMICWCRHCHDEEKNRDEPDPKKRHEIVRKDITHVVCALCDTKQPVGHYCTSCGVSFGQYSCTVCPFYDDNVEKEPFHS